MSNGISLREAQEQDYAFLYNLHREALKDYIDQIWGWDETWQVNYFKENFDISGKMVIQQNDRDIGCLAVRDRGDHIFLSYIALLPPYQGQGIGSYLIEGVLNDARERDMPVILQVLRNNPAQTLYTRLGFRVIDTSETHNTLRYDH